MDYSRMVGGKQHKTCVFFIQEIEYHFLIFSQLIFYRLYHTFCLDIYIYIYIYIYICICK